MSHGRDGDFTFEVIGAAISVHRGLGVGLLESAYEEALAIELGARGIDFERQVRVPASYRGHSLGLVLVADMIIENRLLVELKSTADLHPVYVSQTLTYMRLLGIEKGLLINFFVSRLKEGVRRLSL